MGKLYAGFGLGVFVSGMHVGLICGPHESGLLAPIVISQTCIFYVDVASCVNILEFHCLSGK